MEAISTPRWIAVAARAGYVARGVVYILLGGLTFLAAFDAASSTDTKGAVRTLLGQPFGHYLVGLLVIGLISYVFWRFVQAAFDPDGLGRGPKGILIRCALVVSAFSYSALALYAASLIFTLASQGGGDGAGTFIVQGLNRFFSLRMITLGLAIVFTGMAFSHFWKAGAGTFEKYFKADETAMKFIRPISITGLSARGLIFLTLAWMLVLRFVNSQQDTGSQTKPGLKDAMAYFEKLPFGQWLLAGIGIGLVAFALYSLAEARWRRISTPGLS